MDEREAFVLSHPCGQDEYAAGMGRISGLFDCLISCFPTLATKTSTPQGWGTRQSVLSHPFAGKKGKRGAELVFQQTLQT
jgi:hypothetical protein